MNLTSLSLFTCIFSCHALAVTDNDFTRWERQANNVTITRDDWGIAHIRGQTDADAVFGALYAQAEDDFKRVEMNYIKALGRRAEVEGAGQIWSDLRQRLFVDSVQLKKSYEQSPMWLKKLANAFADGLNFYLHKHQSVHPQLIKRFEPWMVFAFSEGSIGGDIETIDLAELEKFYGATSQKNTSLNGVKELNWDMRGSNGIAIAPRKTASNRALLLINPHTSFYFRSELHMTSDEGLDVYGAATWGQFFIYQGFNEKLGWMHTSSTVDAVDEYLETVSKKGAGFAYEYGGRLNNVNERTIEIAFKNAQGGQSKKAFRTYYTRHGPVVRSEGKDWIAVRILQEPTKALIQSFLRNKTTDLKSFKKTLELYANTSNNTVFADAQGNVAFFFGNFLPKRDLHCGDFTRPVDGRNPSCDWKGAFLVDETPHLINPNSGWIANTNNWPWSAGGADSLKKSDFPSYIDSGVENARGLHAMNLLSQQKKYDLDGLMALAYDNYLPWFEKPLKALTRAWEALPKKSPQKNELKAQIETLAAWNKRWALDSVATSLAVYWGENLVETLRARGLKPNLPLEDFVLSELTPSELVDALSNASKKLASDFGNWKTPWGEINRLQRVTDDAKQPFSDEMPSLAVPFTAGVWGSLASFTARRTEGTKRRYGTGGNTFVAVVEFGDKVRAKAITVGGTSSNPQSLHFFDQSKRYTNGNLRDVYFYEKDLLKHAERSYHPGE